MWNSILRKLQCLTVQEGLSLIHYRDSGLSLLNVVGHSWLTCFCSAVWKAGTDSPFQKAGLRLLQVQGITRLTLPGNIYGRVLSVIQTDLVGTMQF